MAKQQNALTAVPPATEHLLDRFNAARRFSRTLCETLETEDFVIQSMPDVSPTRWHLAHTTWFFETFVLAKAVRGYEPFHEDFVYLFNSYYNAVGEQFPRPQRGLLSRPTVREVFAYRDYVDEHMSRFLADFDGNAELASVIETGLNHEQQHQELMLTDIKHVFSCNPLHPVYREREVATGEAAPLRWIAHEDGVRWIGHDGAGFSYDNERPRHQEFVSAFEIATRPVTCGEFIEFIEDRGYERPELWLSEGWATVQARDWYAPLYWSRREDGWWQFTLSGMRPVVVSEPVCHVSYFEADAFARWKGVWLPTEAAWEIAADGIAIDGNFAESGAYHAVRGGAPRDANEMQQMYGDVWEWTCSPYVAYPNYEAPPGALGEYNGKFMCNQMVLRGGSCATPRSHIRRTYRNFFPPDARWQFSGFRLSRAPQ